MLDPQGFVATCNRCVGAAALRQLGMLSSRRACCHSLVLLSCPAGPPPPCFCSMGHPHHVPPEHRHRCSPPCSTNFFIVRKGELWAPTGKYQLHGITRANVITLARGAGITVQETDFSLTKASTLPAGAMCVQHQCGRQRAAPRGGGKAGRRE